MEERKLKFARNRAKEAPLCPCGQDNKHNSAFAPFDGTDGKAGHCHRCGQTFLPDDTPEVIHTYAPLPRVKQQFVPEPEGIGKKLIDTVLGPEHDGIRTVTFYYRNAAGRLTSAKSMDYHKDTFKRVKDHHPTHLFQRDSGYYACLFNEYSLTKYPKAIVILVESEKTAAIITTRIDPEQFIFLGTGGTGGLTEDKLSVLKGREVWICFDCDQGDLQPDGTILKPKGREAAQAAYLKLAPICTARVIDINPELTDGTDLADLPREQITIDYLRSLPTTTRTPIPAELIAYLRQLNRDGQQLTSDRISELGQSYGINGDRIVTLNRSITDQYRNEANISSAPLVDRLKSWLSSHYEFRRNSLTDIITMRRLTSSQWVSINTATLWVEMNSDNRSIGKGKRGGDLSIAKSDIDNLIESDFVPSFDPIQEYFDSLPPWDGQTDSITALANHITTDDQAFWIKQFEMALIRSIACWKGDMVNRIIMTLIGEEEETGKSSFIRFLAPPPLKEYYKEDPLVHDKDSEIALCENFIWNLEELDELDKKEVSSMKAIISRESVKQRRSYARYESKMRRIVNFWASTNKNDILSDVKNTRWLCFNVLSVNHDYHNIFTGVKNVDIDAVWAQAWALYTRKTTYVLDSDDKTRRDTTNRIFQTMPEEKQLIMRHFKVVDKRDPTAQFMTNFDIRIALDSVSNAKSRFNENNIGRSMKQLGFAADTRRINGKTARGYYVFFSKIAFAYDDQPTPAQLPIDLPF